MGEEDQPRHYQQLVWALRWLAAEPEAALAALEEGFPPAVEMVETLGDALAFGSAACGLDQAVFDAIVEIDQAWEPMVRDDSFLTPEAVRTHDLWRLQRERARAVLVTLGEERADGQLRGNV